MLPLTSILRTRETCCNTLVRLFVFLLVMTAVLAADAVAASGQDVPPKQEITLSADQPAISAVGAPLLTATVTVNGVAVSGQNVVFAWKVKDDPQPPQPGKVSPTKANGKATFRLQNNGGRARTLTVTAALEQSPAITATTDVRFELPAGFIALADSPMTLAAGQAFCRKQGGTLPRINGSDSLPRADDAKVTHIDGFGAPGAPWPSGLLYDRYWTGTAFTGEPAVPGVHGGSWLVGVRSDSVLVHNEGKSVTYRVVCVP